MRADFSRKSQEIARSLTQNFRKKLEKRLRDAQQPAQKIAQRRRASAEEVAEVAQRTSARFVTLFRAARDDFECKNAATPRETVA